MSLGVLFIQLLFGSTGPSTCPFLNLIVENEVLEFAFSKSKPSHRGGFSTFGPLLYLDSDLLYFSFNASRQFIPCSASILRAWYFISSLSHILGLSSNLGRPEAISTKETSSSCSSLSISLRYRGLSFHFILGPF